MEKWVLMMEKLSAAKVVSSQARVCATTVSVNLHDKHDKNSQRACETLHLSSRELSIEDCILPVMLPSKEDIASFVAFAPDAGEGKAFIYLEVRHPDALANLRSALLMGVLKGADSIEQAVSQFYEDPDKYTHDIPAPSMSKPTQSSKDAQSQAYSPPPYAPPTNRGSGAQVRPHTNTVTEAAHVRARDEVRFQLQWW